MYESTGRKGTLTIAGILGDKNITRDESICGWGSNLKYFKEKKEWQQQDRQRLMNDQPN